ncbi:uncharacterized protein LOC121879576 [Homarus americanus]|uniref:Growth hormone secretagogue receptor type 1-like n=1 Tax=Homarus americanus TaxID=6706 RepID=A0A8J5JIJ1_HOMAM|nr:uncharacterized protein LOC121879576 [Homarus americanus]KAG7157831.1 Growth hormone secretagogue receptor type 1-like [Homarus americanus]
MGWLRHRWKYLAGITLVVATVAILILTKSLSEVTRGFHEKSHKSSDDSPDAHPSRLVQEGGGGRSGDVLNTRFGNVRAFKDGGGGRSNRMESLKFQVDFVADDDEDKDAERTRKVGSFVTEKQSLSFNLRQQLDPETSSRPPTTTYTSIAVEGSYSNDSVDLGSDSNYTTGMNNPTDDVYPDYEYYYDDEDNILPTLREISFTRTLFFCEYIYSAMYGEYTNFTDTVIPYGNASLSVVSDEKFLNVCLPFYLRFNTGECEKKNRITVCQSDEIAFLHPHGCWRPSSDDVLFEKLLAATLLQEDEVCFQAVCDGSFRVVERVVQGILVLLISPHTTQGANASCYKYVQEYYAGGPFGSEAVYMTKNIYWSSCFIEYDVLWTREPEPLGLVRAWSYLPPQCRAGESLLVTLVVCVVVSGVTGNILVLVVTARGGHRGEPSNLFRTSLALADLILCLFVLLPSLNVQLSIIDGKMLDPQFHNQYDNIKETPHLTGTRSTRIVVDGGYQLFSAMLTSSCSIISLLTLFALSFERFIVTVKSIQRKILFTRPRVQGFIVTTWATSLLTVLALMHSDGGNVALWYSFYKLSFGVSPQGLRVTLPTVMAILGIVCLLTVVFSLLAVCRYTIQKARKAAEMRELGETDLDQSKEKPIGVLTIMVLMTIFFVFSTTLAFVASVLQLSAASVPRVELVCYLCWWGFLAAASWNPWLYHLPSQHFRHDVIAIITSLVPRSMRDQSWLRSLIPQRWRKDTSPSDGVDIELNTVKKKSKKSTKTLPGMRNKQFRSVVI